MPSVGHIVHMPSHIYWRVGRYADAVSTNSAAVQADRAYFKTAQPRPIYGGLCDSNNIVAQAEAVPFAFLGPATASSQP